MKDKIPFGERVKRMIRSWLNIEPAQPQSFTLMENMTFETEIMRSRLWYRGDANELMQFFKQLDGDSGSFWKSVPSGSGETVRKIHSGLPEIIVDVLAYIVKADLNEPKVSSEDWKGISEAVDFIGLIGSAVSQTLICGDGAFKIVVDEGAEYPSCEFIPADRVELEMSGGTVKSMTFRTDYRSGGKSYSLFEKYSKGRIETSLYTSDGKEAELSAVPELADINPVIVFDGDYIMGVPLKFYSSPKYSGRGKSIFSGGKSDCFDALDEVISQWWDAIRSGRVQKYIPEDMIPRDSVTGTLKPVDSFGTSFVTVASVLKEGGETPKIEVVQPEIRYEAFVSSYTNALLMCLQGLISPATLGIDVGKMSSGEAQREKKDVTGDTRNTMTSALEKALPRLIEALLKTYDNMLGRTVGEYKDISVTFGEYGAPDFDSRVETVGKAGTYGIMSIDTQIEELWGSSKDDKWKAAEKLRIMHEKGLLEAEPPAVGDELAKL